MSQARVTRVEKSMKPAGPCERRGCEVVIEKGMPYLWYKVGFRSKHKHVRCVDHPPRPSERESSNLASAYAAVEDFEDQIGGLETVDDIQSALEEVAEAFRELASEYEEASTDDNGTVFNTVAEERAEALESAADEIDGWYPDEDEPAKCEKHEGEEDDLPKIGEPLPEDEPECPDCEARRQEWIEGIRESATSAVNDVDFGG